MNALKWLIENRKTIGIALIITIIGIAGNLDFNDQVTIEKAAANNWADTGTPIKSLSLPILNVYLRIEETEKNDKNFTASFLRQ
ncbi:Uncharacterised protein [[Pasteurella] mairii]|uniref:Uncharacterized protein n=1 Tax=[Pasteurella] mairii TaxID=757 RepID=A0A379B062_9PAST|nr:Uncharacterised protein [[Pasteurella] mairii]